MMILSADSGGLIEAAGDGIGTVIGWLGEILTAIISGALSPLLPLLGISVAISAVFLCIKVFRVFAWGT